ncbi:hypothetical protein [Haloferax sp. Atlit-19N]|uniref:hypothetical protein n=1 Tax=Haloferax sp. Atlit-19N TaxID=2077201 RepID=UPI0011C025E9|nr:hypothetical protein [Haloferax sp. Atlit-19N]
MEPPEEPPVQGDSGPFEISDIKSSPVEPLVERYPFEQHKYEGTLTYHEESSYTPGRSINVDFEYRDGSNLFIVEYKTDLSSTERLVREIETAVPQIQRIYRNLHAAEDSLWRFLESADRILEINVLVNGKETPYDEIEDVPREDVIGNYAIESAIVGLNHQGHSITVHYEHGTLQIESDWDRGTEFVIQLFEREILHGSK